MCALEELRDGLRRRDVYVTPSERFADARSSLLSDAAWDASRDDTCRALSLPNDPEVFIAQLADDLDDAYQRTRETLTPPTRDPRPRGARGAARRMARRRAPDHTLTMGAETRARPGGGREPRPGCRGSRE